MGPPKPQPTKPKIKLPSKVKTLAWKRFINDPKNVNFWSKLQEQKKISIDDIVNNFGFKKKPQQNQDNSIKASIEQKAKAAKQRFLNDKRTQVVGITIAKLPPISQVAEALSTMNNSLLTPSNIESMKREFITEEELNEYKNNNDTNVVWDIGEAYLIGLYNIPFSKQKLTIWNFVLSFGELNSIVNKVLGFYGKACEEIKNSDFIKTIFSYILTVGNIMNGGSNQGQADGFNLDILPKLSSIKDNRNKTLLQYICTTMKEQTGRDYTNFKRNFENVKEAAMNIFNESQTILNTIKKGAKEASTAITAITIDDVFMKRAKDLVNKANTEIEKTAKKFEEVEKNCQALIKNFGYEEKDAKYNKIEEFFKLFNNFFEDVDRAMPKEELKKVYNRKHEVGTKIDECRSSLMNELKSGKVQLKKKV